MKLKKIYYTLPNKLRIYIVIEINSILAYIEEKFINSNSGDNCGSETRVAKYRMIK
jgi:hypothetical protein